MAPCCCAWLATRDDDLPQLMRMADAPMTWPFIVAIARSAAVRSTNCTKPQPFPCHTQERANNEPRIQAHRSAYNLRQEF